MLFVLMRNFVNLCCVMCGKWFFIANVLKNVVCHSEDVNRNIDEDRNGNDGSIEIININSPLYNSQDSNDHEAAINEAWRFICASRHENFTEDESNQETSSHSYLSRTHHKGEFKTENEEQKYYTRAHVENTASYEEREKKSKIGTNLWFSAINEYLDSIDNSSEEESSNIIEQNNLYINDLPHENIIDYDSKIYTVADARPTYIYSYKNKSFTAETNEFPINSPEQESQSNSTSSTSVENLNEESTGYEKSFYRVSTSFRSVIIPRLPLTYMLPTVTEIHEPHRQSPKITDITHEEDKSVKRKLSNSWVMDDSSSSNSEANNTIETNIENSADESSSPNHTSSRNVSVLNQFEDHIEVDIKNQDTFNADSKISTVLHPKRTKPTFRAKSTESYFTTNKFDKDEKVIRTNNFIQTEEVNVEGNKNIEKDYRKFKQRNVSPYTIEMLSDYCFVPSLHLSLTDIDTIEQSWCKRFITCILCCK